MTRPRRSLAPWSARAPRVRGPPIGRCPWDVVMTHLRTGRAAEELEHSSALIPWEVHGANRKTREEPPRAFHTRHTRSPKLSDGTDTSRSYTTGGGPTAHSLGSAPDRSRWRALSEGVTILFREPVGDRTIRVAVGGSPGKKGYGWRRRSTKPPPSQYSHTTSVNGHTVLGAYVHASDLVSPKTDLLPEPT